MKTITFLLFFLMLFAMAQAQNIINQQSADPPEEFKCGTMEYMEHLKTADPLLRTRWDELEAWTQDWISKNPAFNTKTTITIPVVIHIVYNTTAENISDTRVYEQIDVLNRDYAGLNTHSMQAFSTTLKANTGLQFCLAQKDPNGNPTTGIERRQTSVTEFSYTNDPVKHYSTGGLDAWDVTKYMNIWVCDLPSGLCGYAQFPAYLAGVTTYGVNATFGLVVDYTCFGVTGTTAPQNQGGTTTHELGHCFNLYHTWGDVGDVWYNYCLGSDQCADVPNQYQSTPTASTSTTYTGVRTDQCTYVSPGIMYTNFMDYTGDQEWANFTPNQTSRIQACFASGGPLYSLTLSDACTPPGTTCGVPSGLNATSVTTTSATLGWTAVTGATSYSIQYRQTGTTTWTTLTSSTNSITINGLTAATSYEFQVQTVCSSGSSTYSSSYTFTTQSIVTCGVPSGLTATSITTSSATLTWTAVSGATSYNVQYRQAGTTTWTTTSTSGTSLAISGLVSSTTYEFQVQTVCSSGTSAYSAAATFTTLTPVSCGVPAGLTATNITTGSVTLSWTAVTGATSYSVRIKPVSSTTWTTATATTTSINFTGLTANTQYEFQVSATCSGGTSAYSASALFTTPQASGYCTSNSLNYSTYGYIYKVSVGTFTKYSGASAYSNFTSYVIPLTPGSYTSLSFSNGAFTFNYWRVWIDYNKDGDFLDAGEQVWSGYGNAPSGGFIVPSTASGQTRMRVSMKTYSYPSPCEIFSYGEVEDYTVSFGASKQPSFAFYEEFLPAPVISDVLVFPNPASGNAKVSFSSDNDCRISLKMTDPTGRTVFAKESDATKGSNEINLDLYGLPDGLYFIEMSEGNCVERVKLVIERE